MNFDFLSLRKSVRSLGEHLSQLRIDIETLKRKRDDLLAAPSTREDVLAVLHARIDAEGKTYTKMLKQSWQPMIRKGMRVAEFDNPPMLTATNPGTAATAYTDLTGFFGPNLSRDYWPRLWN